jgi:trehalose monomycolate/heme transporter
VIGAFSTSGVTFIKLIGVGMLIMLLLDATVVRDSWYRPPAPARGLQLVGAQATGTVVATPRAPRARPTTRPSGAAVRPSTAHCS